MSCAVTHYWALIKGRKFRNFHDFGQQVILPKENNEKINFFVPFSFTFCFSLSSFRESFCPSHKVVLKQKKDVPLYSTPSFIPIAWKWWHKKMEFTSVTCEMTFLGKVAFFAIFTSYINGIPPSVPAAQIKPVPVVRPQIVLWTRWSIHVLWVGCRITVLKVPLLDNSKKWKHKAT